MENQQNIETEQKKTIGNHGDIVVGENVPSIEPKPVIMEDYRIEDMEIKGKPSQKLILLCKHPDVSDKLIEISSAKYTQGDKIKQSGLWWKTDKDGKIPYNSAVANLIRNKGGTNLNSMKGMTMETLADDKGYLVIKAY